MKYFENTAWYSDFAYSKLKASGSAVFLFLVWPISALILAFKNYRIKWSRDIFWLFCVFFGFTFIIAGEGGADSDRYARNFIAYAHSDLNLKDIWSYFYSATEDSKLDIALTLINYFVSRLTDNPSILFMVFGFIFGYFYSRNIWYVLDKINGKLTGIIILYILSFALFNPIWNINGFRFNTAAQIFLFGTLPYLLEGKTSRLLWSGASILFHFSFLLPSVILILFIIFKNRTNLYFGFFIFTVFIKEIDIQQVQSLLLYLPNIFHSKVTAYTNPDFAKATWSEVQELNWYVPYSAKVVKWVIYLLVLYIFFLGKDLLKERPDLKTLFSFSLLFYGFTNILSFIPSGGRFVAVVNTFMFPLFIILTTNYHRIKSLSVIMVFSVPLLLLFCIVSLRVGMDYIGLMTVIGNPMIAAFGNDNLPLIAAIKGFLF